MEERTMDVSKVKAGITTARAAVSDISAHLAKTLTDSKSDGSTKGKAAKDLMDAGVVDTCLANFEEALEALGAKGKIEGVLKKLTRTPKPRKSKKAPALAAEGKKK
jgi:hypothetical protein